MIARRWHHTAPGSSKSSLAFALMAWSWRCETGGGETVTGVGSESFPTQADAETWIGETWRDLLDKGVDQVVLLEGDREVYGPMSLHAT